MLEVQVFEGDGVKSHVPVHMLCEYLGWDPSRWIDGEPKFAVTFQASNRLPGHWGMDELVFKHTAVELHLVGPLKFILKRRVNRDGEKGLIEVVLACKWAWSFDGKNRTDYT